MCNSDNLFVYMYITFVSYFIMSPLGFVSLESRNRRLSAGFNDGYIVCLCGSVRLLISSHAIFFLKTILEKIALKNNNS